jgi:serine/threonine protein kinase
MTKQCAVIDTCVLLADPDFIVRAAKIGFPVVTSVVLGEIDYNKKNRENGVSTKAKEIFKKIKNQAPEWHSDFPCGKKIKTGDKLCRFEFDTGSLFVLIRDEYRVMRSNFSDNNTYNDATLREIAKDYGLPLVTLDGGNKTIAEVEGIRAIIWRKPVDAASVKKETRNFVPSVRPFDFVKSIISEGSVINNSMVAPVAGDVFKLGLAGQLFTLGSQLGSGGEGFVFELLSDDRVAKIYKCNRLTENKIKKLKLMASRAVARSGICWPQELVYTKDNVPVGYVMQRARGYPLQKSVFVKALLSQRFPNWKRENLVKVCVSFLEKVEYLHSLNVLVGDINPMNLLVGGDGSDVFIVDMDSFQVEGFPCPVGTVNFSPPRLQKKDFSSLLRTQEDELFAVATMLFMILVPGKPPYSQQGGESPEKNIVEANFPYAFGDDHKGRNVSAGPWRYIWSHLPFKLKQLFHNAFRERQNVQISDWLVALRACQSDIARGYISNEIFPLGFKVPKGQGVAVTCGQPGCGKSFEMYRDSKTELDRRGQYPLCPSCLRVRELERLAQVSNTLGSASGELSGQPAWKWTYSSRTTASITNPSNVSGSGRASGVKSGFVFGARNSQHFSHSQVGSAPLNTPSENDSGGSGLFAGAIFLIVLGVLGRIFGWWIIPVILVGIVVMALRKGNIPR